MKTLIFLLIISTASAQMLPVWNVLSPVITNPYDGDTVDGKYAAMPYVDVRKWTDGVLKYNALQTIKHGDRWTLRVHAKIPHGCYFFITAQKDTSTFSVLYEYKNPVSDNQQSAPIDTILQVDDLYDYGGEFYRFAIVRYWHPRETQDTMFIDALELKVQQDTIFTPRDTVRDTISLSVKPLKIKRALVSGANKRDVLGRPADTLHSRYWFWQDTSGRWRVRIK